MNKTKLVFIISFLIITAFVLILSYYFSRAKNKKLTYLFELGEKVSRQINEEPANAAVVLRFNRDDTKIITLLNNGRVELWDLNRKTRTILTETVGLFSYCAAKDLLITKNNDQVYLVDIVSDYKRLITTGNYKLASVDKSCKTAALSTGTNEIEIWDLTSTALKSKIKTTLPVRNGLALSADAKIVAAAQGVYHKDRNRHETIIEIWDLASEYELPILKYDKRDTGTVVGVWNIFITSDNNKVGFDTQSSAESGIMLIDLDGNTVFEKSGFKSYWMRASDYNLVNNLLATGDEENNLVVWDINSEGIGFYNKMAEVVESVSFSNDGSLIAAGIADSTIQVFSADK